MFEVKRGNWNEAARKCEKAGGGLATVISENCTLRNLTERFTYFIGGKKSSSGKWTWVDGTQMNQTHWASGEPNNHGGNENCLQMQYTNKNYQWNDISCDSNNNHGYICQSECRNFIH
ncbi:perlucin-like, partial [Saccostrea cucullata]|uniref:perlucin-like n=1 Tax=Saccostrea cuccullata TaxID=36930 RepID=UPI002ED58130